MHMETPHFPLKIFEYYFSKVYEPAEDTFLLLDALEGDLERIREIKPTVCVEIGSGSGAVITSLAKALGHTESTYLAVDLNRDALECTRRCAELNLGDTAHQSIQVVQSDLASALRLDHAVDLILFNPPYVPTEENEVDTEGGIAAAWAGGTDGRRVMDRFLCHTLPCCLSSTGLAYLVTLEANHTDQIKLLSFTLGLECHQIIARRCGREKLAVLRFSRRQAQ